MRKFLYKVIVVWLNLYTLKSKFVQWFWYRDQVGKSYTGIRWRGLTPEIAQLILSRIDWRPDGWREGWDAFHHPDVGCYLLNQIIHNCGKSPRNLYNYAVSDKNRFIEEFNDVVGGPGKQPDISFDCDDFASLALSMIYPRNPTARILNVVWSKSCWPYFAGHNVCIYRHEGDYYYISNGQVKPSGPYPSENYVILNILDGRDYVGHRYFELKDIAI